MTMMRMMTISGFPTPLFEGEGGGAGAGGGGTGDAGAPPPPPPAPDASGGGSGGSGGEGGTPPAKWYEAEAFDEDARRFVALKGLVDKPLEEALPTLLKGWRGAEKQLGKSPDTILDRPGKDEKLADWMRKNGELFGVPKDAEGYKLEPGDLPKGVTWDKDFEAKARAVAHEHALPEAALGAMAKLYTEQQAAQAQRWADEQRTSTEAMRAELAKDWGPQLPAKTELAKRALAHLGQKAGLDGDALLDATAALEEKTGSANLLRLFAALGEQLGEDTLIGGLSGGGMATTPADAMQKLEEMKQPDHAYQKALRANDRAALQRFNEERSRLFKIAAPAGR